MKPSGFLTPFMILCGCSGAKEPGLAPSEMLERVESSLLNAKTLSFRYERRMRDYSTRDQVEATDWETGAVVLVGAHQGRIDVTDRKTQDSFYLLSDGVRAVAIHGGVVRMEYENYVVQEWREKWIRTLFRNGFTGGKPGEHIPLKEATGAVSNVRATPVTVNGRSQILLEYTYENRDGYSPFRNRLWIDAASYLPEKLMIESSVDGDEFTSTLTYGLMSLDEPVDLTRLTLPRSK